MADKGNASRALCILNIAHYTAQKTKLNPSYATYVLERREVSAKPSLAALCAATRDYSAPERNSGEDKPHTKTNCCGKRLPIATHVLAVPCLFNAWCRAAAWAGRTARNPAANTFSIFRLADSLISLGHCTSQPRESRSSSSCACLSWALQYRPARRCSVHTASLLWWAMMSL